MHPPLLPATVVAWRFCCAGVVGIFRNLLCVYSCVPLRSRRARRACGKVHRAPWISSPRSGYFLLKKDRPSTFENLSRRSFDRCTISPPGTFSTDIPGYWCSCVFRCLGGETHDEIDLTGKSSCCCCLNDCLHSQLCLSRVLRLSLKVVAPWCQYFRDTRRQGKNRRAFPRRPLKSDVPGESFLFFYK